MPPGAPPPLRQVGPNRLPSAACCMLSGNILTNTQSAAAAHAQQTRPNTAPGAGCYVLSGDIAPRIVQEIHDSSTDETHLTVPAARQTLPPAIIPTSFEMIGTITKDIPKVF